MEMENEKVQIAVCGLHMRGFALHYQLTSLQAEYVETTYTKPQYKLYALPTFPEKPAIVKTISEKGEKIEVELYELTYDALGRFMEVVPSPLGLGKILLEDGREVIGFICEPYALDNAFDITVFKGWRYYNNDAAKAFQ